MPRKATSARPKAQRKTLRGIRGSAATADRTAKLQKAIHALGDVLSGVPAIAEAQVDFAGQLGLLDEAAPKLAAKATVRDAILALQATLGSAAEKRLTAIVSGTDNAYANEQQAKAIGAKAPVPVSAK